MSQARRSAVVVGGGIGGVASALALIRIGWHVVVLERSAQPADAGSGITLFANALAALDAIGAGDSVRAAGAPPPAGSSGLRLPSGEVVVDASAMPAVHDLYGFHRADLHASLRSQLPDGVLRVGTEVTGVREDAGKALVDLAGGGRLEAELVVAADGVRSRIRSSLHPGYAGPRYAGYTSWRGVTSEPVEVAGIAGETWGAGERFGILPLRDGRVYWFAVANLPPATARPPQEEVARRFGGWHAPIAALISATPPETILSLDIYDLTLPLPSFAVGPVALLGDAAHAMTPDVGQGAGQAIEDAVVLAATLARGPTVVEALAGYDRERRRRTARIVRAARRTGRLAQAERPLAVRLRTLLMRLTPASASLKMVQQITSWTPPEVPCRTSG